MLKKENLTISIGEYEKDGQTKKQWRTIGELITMQGDDGQPYQFFKLWGASGVTEGKVFAQDNNQQQPQQGFQGQNQGFQQPAQQQYNPNQPPPPPANQPMGAHQAGQQNGFPQGDVPF
jgi:hypothetical protein